MSTVVHGVRCARIAFRCYPYDEVESQTFWRDWGNIALFSELSTLCRGLLLKFALDESVQGTGMFRLRDGLEISSFHSLLYLIDFATSRVLVLHKMDMRGLNTSEALQRLLNDMHDVVQQDKLQELNQNKYYFQNVCFKILN